MNIKSIKYRNEKLEPYVEGEPYFQITDFGSKVWYNTQGQLHRENAPAYEGHQGDKVWYWNGQCHMEDGPAIEYSDGDKMWFLNDIQFDNEKQWKIELEKRYPKPPKEVFCFFGYNGYENIEL